MVAEQLERGGVVLADDDAGDLSSLGQHHPSKGRAAKTLPLLRGLCGAERSRRAFDGQLEHRGSAALPREPARRDAPPDGDRLAIRIEEDEIERESHAEGVDAGAARDQQAGAGLVTVEMAKAEQASTEVGGVRHLVAEQRDGRKATQARGEGSMGHAM